MSKRNPSTKPTSAVAPTEIHADRARQRRAKYASVPEYADATRSANRGSYQKDHPPTRKLAGGLLFPGTLREVTYDDAESPHSVESYSIAEVAKALGKSEVTIRRWIEADKIPAPYLRDTTKGNKVYSVGEADVMRRILSQYEAEYTYLGSTNHTAVSQMHEHMHAYRVHNI